MAPSHNRDMESLDKDHKENPSVAAKLRKGYFDSRLTPPPPPPLDQEHEQNNKIVKGDSGGIGLTETHLGKKFHGSSMN